MLATVITVANVTAKLTCVVFTTGKLEFVVCENLCRAFSFGCTAKSFFAVCFNTAHDKEKTHDKK
jgi:hypothetical protein